MTTSGEALTASSSWEEILTLRGRHFRSGWFQVDDAHVEMFDRAAYADENSYQLEESLYPEGLVEGFHLLSLLDHLVNGVLFIENTRWTGWNYGLDRVRFVSPVTTMDRFRVEGLVQDIEPRGEGFVIVMDCRVVVEGREKPGATAVWRALWTLSAEEAA